MRRRAAHALSFRQGRELLARLPNPARDMALLSMTTSMNVAEMLGLRWGRVNLTGEPAIVGAEVVPPHSLLVRENYYRGEFGTVKAASRRRTVPLSSSVVEALASAKRRGNFTEPDDLVFASTRGTPLDETNLMRRLVKPVAKELGMPWVSWHVFRHTHATLGEQIGMALSDRQAQLGHGDVRMTLHYTHADIERRRAGIETMTGLLVDEAGVSVQ